MVKCCGTCRWTLSIVIAHGGSTCYATSSSLIAHQVHMPRGVGLMVAKIPITIVRSMDMMSMSWGHRNNLRKNGRPPEAGKARSPRPQAPYIASYIHRSMCTYPSAVTRGLPLFISWQNEHQRGRLTLLTIHAYPYLHQLPAHLSPLRSYLRTLTLNNYQLLG